MDYNCQLVHSQKGFIDLQSEAYLCLMWSSVALLERTFDVDWQGETQGPFMGERIFSVLVVYED